MRDPDTLDEWRTAVTLAEVLLELESARLYGLIRGGPTVDGERCRALLAQGRARGVVPRAADVNAATAALVRELCEPT
jgi:hypothetical protein